MKKYTIIDPEAEVETVEIEAEGRYDAATDYANSIYHAEGAFDEIEFTMVDEGGSEYEVVVDVALEPVFDVSVLKRKRS